MDPEPQIYCFQQLHVDIARNATDDFNPFHDPNRWHHIRGNPFAGPIVLGFQLAALADYRIDQQRLAESDGTPAPIGYSNYDFRFARVLQPGQPFRVEVRRKIQTQSGAASNRVMIRLQDGQAILLGSRSDTLQPLLPLALHGPETTGLDNCGDRHCLPNTRLFLKRKYLTTSNGKNFLLGSLIDPYFYFDELAERVSFPPMYTASLLSCALLERIRADDYPFEENPQVYVSHRFTIDRKVQQALRSNNRLDILVHEPEPFNPGKGLAQSGIEQQLLECVAVVAGSGPLFRAQVRTASLNAILTAP